MREAQTEVLVVGAGPVGLWTAVLLAEAGVQVTIIDREQRTTSRSYACALHPATLKMLQRMSLLEPILEQGRRIDTVAFYDEQSRRAELRLSALKCEFPFLVILPQSALETILEHRLRRAGVNVHWNHRFDSLDDETELVLATVEELGGTGTGYIIPHWEMVVKNRAPVRCQFLVGADGYNSVVRHRLGIECERITGPTSFAAYEFETDQPLEPELRVVLGQTTNVLWPLPGQKCRWTFQIVHSELAGEFPEKERRSARLAQANVDERIRQYVEKVSCQRAPWFKAAVKEIVWCTEIAFEQRLARQYGRNRCWLAGDAAHQTGPVGVQSMNEGFVEAETLAQIFASILRQPSSRERLIDYDRQHRERWQRLFGLKGGLKPTRDTDPWVRENAARILPCLPATGPDAVLLASQLGLDMP